MTTNDNKEFRIYLRRKKQLIVVTREVYLEYYRPIWAQRKRAQTHGQCTCTYKKLWMCDGECADCKYHSTGDMLSLEYQYNNDLGSTELSETMVSPVNIESIISDHILLEEICEDFKELDADGQRIFELLGEDLSDRKIAKALGRTQSTFNYQIRKIRAELKKRYPDIF